MASRHRTSVALSPERPYLFDRKAGLTELGDHFLPYLKTVRTYGRAYDSPHFRRLAAIPAGQDFDGQLGNMLHSAFPPCVYGSDSPVHRIVEQHRHAVGRTDSDGQPGHIRHERIETLQLFPGHPPFNNGNPGVVHLMSLDDRIRQRRIPPCREGLNPGSQVVFQQSVRPITKIRNIV